MTLDLGAANAVDVAGDVWVHLTGVTLSLSGWAGLLRLAFTFQPDNAGAYALVVDAANLPAGWVAQPGLAEDGVAWFTYQTPVDTRSAPGVIKLGVGRYMIIAFPFIGGSLFTPGTLSVTVYVDGVALATDARHLDVVLGQPGSVDVDLGDSWVVFDETSPTRFWVELSDLRLRLPAGLQIPSGHLQLAFTHVASVMAPWAKTELRPTHTPTDWTGAGAGPQQRWTYGPDIDATQAEVRLDVPSDIYFELVEIARKSGDFLAGLFEVTVLLGGRQVGQATVWWGQPRPSGQTA